MLDREDIEALLDELGRELEHRGIHGDLFVVGGAAMALAYSQRRATRDLDAVFEPKAEITDAARVVAERHDLPEDWLNDAVKGFLPGEETDATVLFERQGLSVRVASPRYLFAMKTAASRVERDADDLRTLYERCGFRSVDEALDAVQSIYPEHLLPPKAELLLRELFPPGT